MTVRIIGVGNELRGDDGVGRAVARHLQAHVPPDVEVMEREGDATSLMEAWQGAQRVILIDATSCGAAPGTVHQVDAAQPLPSGLLRASTHGCGVADAVELARALGTLPSKLIIYGVEGMRFDLGTPLSAPVRAAVGRFSIIAEAGHSWLRVAGTSHSTLLSHGS
jgi:hydrogenase maturation protease